MDTALGTVRVQVGGSGEPIMFWPSLLMTGDMWHGVAADSVQHSRVILVDPPGHGGSQPLTDMFSFGDCARCSAGASWTASVLTEVTLSATLVSFPDVADMEPGHEA